MHTPTTAWDRGPTDKELTSFYGDAATAFDKHEAIERHAAALDDDDLCQVVQEYSLAILFAVKTGNAQTLMDVFTKELKQVVARRASVELFGDVAVIKAQEVVL